MKSPPAPSPSGAFPRPSTTPERILPETKGNAYDAGYFHSWLLCRWRKLGPSFHYPHAPPPPHVPHSALVFPALKKPEFPFMAGDVTCLVIGGDDMPAVTSLLAQVLDMASRLQWQPPEDLPRFEVRTRHSLCYLYVRSARVIHSVIYMSGPHASFGADQRDSEKYPNSFRICSWPEY